MKTTLVAFELAAHILFWGAGLAWLAMPRRWGKFWAALVAPAGLALQSAVVWAGAHTSLAGTNAYGLASEAIPAALLALAVGRRGGRGWLADGRRFAGVGLAMIGCLGALGWALGGATRGLTTVSLGSCDAADYAAGARVLQEFSRDERGGFLGLTEVVRVLSVDNFFDYWIRLNHFTPSALIALNGTALGYEPAKITGLMTAVILALSLPTVCWLARTTLGLRGAAGGLVALLYGLNPVTWYAVAQVAPGQVLAAQGIALITWAGWAAWQRPTWALGAPLAVGYWLLLGSYNFIVLAGLAPAALWALASAGRGGAWRRLPRWTAVMLAPLAGCAVVFFERVAGLAERLTLLRAYDFGWKIPALTPEGWLGAVGDVTLNPVAGAGRWLGCAAVVAGAGWGLAARGGRAATAAACLVAPALAGYVFLHWRAASLGTNASYDAYKLLAVFFPGVLATGCAWLLLLWRRERGAWVVAAALAAGTLAAHGAAVAKFHAALAAPALVVTRELRDVQKLEARPEVASLNLRVPDMWSRLWANALLLRKPQYFLTHTYEGRLNTPLRGEWDLTGGIVRVRLPGGATREAGAGYRANDTRDPAYVRAEWGDGWHAEESLAATGERWRWSQGDRAAELRIENPQTHPVTVAITVDGRALAAGEVALGGAWTKMGAERAKISLGEAVVPPGNSTLSLRWRGSGPAAPTGDARKLGLCVWGVELAARP